jgi:uncharacterized repeat protein (TIGR01451 family)
MKHLMLKASCGALFLLCSQAVLAHNANISAEMVCDTDTGTWKISYTSTTWADCANDNWDPDGLSCANGQIGIYLYEVTGTTPDQDAARLLIEPDSSGDPAAKGVFGPDNTSSFSGHVASPTQTAGDLVFVTAKPLIPWGDAFPAPTNRAPSGQPGAANQQYRAVTVEVPTEESCEVPPEPSLAILKEVSVDGGVSYHDANDAESAPSTLVGGDALYRITVTNTGNVDLVDVLVTDPTLSFSETVTISAGASAVFENPMPDVDISSPFAELYVDPVCTEPGLVPNTANAKATFRDTDLEETDPANVLCEAPEVGCWFTGGQNITINRVRGRPEHSGGGNIYPSCSALPGDGGQWTHTDHDQELHFQARSLTVVECGNVAEIPPGAPSPAVSVNFIKATAVGIIKGIGGNDLEETEATAVLIMEDWGEPGRDDKYTIQAMGGGAVISLDRAPLVRGGNFQIHQSSCDN